MREVRWYDNNRDRLSLGYPDRPYNKDWLIEFYYNREKKSFLKVINLCINRLVMGTFRYGRRSDSKNNHYDSVESIDRKIKKYKKTHNLECLIDLINYCVLEFNSPSFPDSNFESEDDVDHCKLKNGL